MNEDVKKLTKELRNIGYRNAQKLVAIGIFSKKDLEKKGVYETFIEIFESDLLVGKPHPAYLYALYGAIQDIDWRKIPEEKKEEYKKFIKDLKNSL